MILLGVFSALDVSAGGQSFSHRQLVHELQAPPHRHAARDPGHLLVLALKDAPDRGSVTALQSAIAGRETVRVEGRHAYIVYPDGIGRSRLTTVVIEKQLETRVTGRNWNTVLKLGALVK